MSDTNAQIIPPEGRKKRVFVERDFFSEPTGALIKTTLVDFPGRVASSLFLKGCNLRCPYCYNWELIDASLGSNANVSEPVSEAPLSTINEVLSHLEKRRNVLTGFVISGGEPLLFPHLADLISEAKKLGFKIKLDTNGTLPERLQTIMENPATAPDFIAMDIKTSPERYGIVTPHAKKSASVQDIAEKLARSASLIATLPSTSREWRTVLVPPMVKKEDIDAIAALLPKDASWQFAQFRNENCLDASYNDIAPYTDAQATELVSYARTLISGAQLR